jgi:hypothetical protein
MRRPAMAVEPTALRYCGLVLDSQTLMTGVSPTPLQPATRTSRGTLRFAPRVTVSQDVRIALALAVLLFGIYGIVSAPRFQAGYEGAYSAGAEGILHTGLPELPRNSPIVQVGPPLPGPPPERIFPGGSVGWAGPATAVPWIAGAAIADRAAHLLGGSGTFFRLRAAYTFPALLTALTAALLFLVARGFYPSRRRCVFLALGFGLTTLAVPYTRIGMEPPLMLWTTAGFGALLAARRTGRTRWLGAAGLALGLAASTRQPAGPVLELPLLVYGITVAATSARRWYGAAALLGPFVACNLLSLAYGLERCGAVLCTSGYLTGDARLRPDVMEAVIGLTVSPGKSIFVTSPILLLAVAGLARARRRYPWEIAAIAATVLLAVAIVSALSYWSDEVYGARYLVFVVPLLVLTVGFALGWDRAPDGAPEPRPRAWRAAVALACAGAIVQAVAIIPEGGSTPCTYVLQLLGPTQFNQNECRFVPELSDVAINGRLTFALLDRALGGTPKLTYEPFVGPPDRDAIHRYTLTLGTPSAPLAGPDFFWWAARTRANIALLATFVVLAAAGGAGVRRRATSS